MNEQLANMIARHEYMQNTSHTPLLDFDRRGDTYTPGWLEQGVSALRRLITRHDAQDESAS